MAYSNSNNGNQRKRADGFINIWFRLPNGEYRKVGERGVALYNSNGLGKSILAHAESNPDFEFDLIGRVTIWNPDAEVDKVDLFGSPVSAPTVLAPEQSTGTDDSIPF